MLTVDTRGGAIGLLIVALVLLGEAHQVVHRSRL